MATKVKVEFVLEEPDKDAAINIKSGDVLIVRQVEPEAPAVEGSAAAATPLGCFTSDGKMVGLVPQAAARQVAGFGDAQASVRSIKRDTTGAVSQLMLRVVLTEDGPMQLGALCYMELHATMAQQPCDSASRFWHGWLWGGLSAA